MVVVRGCVGGCVGISGCVGMKGCVTMREYDDSKRGAIGMSLCVVISGWVGMRGGVLVNVAIVRVTAYMVCNGMSLCIRRGCMGMRGWVIRRG